MTQKIMNSQVKQRHWSSNRLSTNFLLIMIALPLCLNERQLVHSWHFFNGVEGGGRAIASAIAPHLDQIQHLNLPPQSQLLIPVGSHQQHLHYHHQHQQLQQQQSQHQPNIIDDSPQAPSEASSGGSVGAKLMSDIMSAASNAAVSALKDDDQTERDSPASPSANPIDRSSSNSAESSPPTHQQQQVTPEDSLPSTPSISLPSVGKILEAVQSSIANSSSSDSTTNSSASPSTRTEKLANVALQILKPRKQDGKHLSYAEEQIINQHARVHLTGHSHQRLLPTKQRDNKLANAFLSSDSLSSGSSDGRDSPLNSLFGNLKSGISSRSSIVKAISDNKLARTLSTLGKSISGNKYVAGAAAASAIAALGLTMSKFLSPYLFAGGFSKLGDGSMTSSSFLNPSYVNPNRANNLPLSISNPEGMLSSSSSIFKSQFLPYSDTDLTPLDSQPSSSSATQQEFGSLTGGSSGNQDQLYYTYTAKKPAKSSQTTSSSDTNALFNDYYPYSKTGDSSIYTSSSSQLDPSVYSISSSLSNGDYSTSNADTQQFVSSGAGFQPSRYQSVSYDTPMASPTISSYKYSYPSYGTTSRRSGAMGIKLDDATRAKLSQLLKQQPLFTFTLAPPVLNQQSSNGYEPVNYEFPQYSPSNTFVFPSTTGAGGDSSSDYLTTGSSDMIKAGRIENPRPSNYLNERSYASAATYSDSRAVAATQSVPKIISQPSYIILRPNTVTKSPLTMTMNEPDLVQRSAKQLNTEQAATSGLLKQHQSSGSPWRSLDSMDTQSSIPQKQHTPRPATTSTLNNNKQSNNNTIIVSTKQPEEQQQQQQQQHSVSVTDQQVSTKVPLNLLNNQQQNLGNNSKVLQRNSRTPTDGLVKVLSSSGVARQSSLPQAIKVVGDQQQQQQQHPESKSVNSYQSTSRQQVNYSAEGLKQQQQQPWMLAASGGNAATTTGPKQRTTANDTPTKQLLHVDSNSDKNKINLIQLNNEENDVAADEEQTASSNKNIIKLVVLQQ